MWQTILEKIFDRVVVHWQTTLGGMLVAVAIAIYPIASTGKVPTTADWIAAGCSAIIGVLMPVPGKKKTGDYLPDDQDLPPTERGGTGGHK